MKNRADAVWGGGILPGNAGNTVADACGMDVSEVACCLTLFPFLFAKADTGTVDNEETLFP